MRDVFLTVLNMSLTACLIIAVVLPARWLLRRAPKVFSYALWAVVLFRLLCPFTIPSPVSLVASSQPIPPGTVESPKFYIASGVSAIDMPVNDYLGDHYFEGVTRPANLKADFFAGASKVWLAGVAALGVYSLVSLLLFRRKLAGSVPLEGEDNVRLADHIPSPFVLGLFRPVIYLPSGLPEEERAYILLHERTHIRRFDHVFRALAWLAAVIHWFNPLVWLSFHLAGHDMEMSCDEAVLQKLGPEVRADYSASLLRLSAGKRLPAGPLAFGGGDLKGRIKNVLGWEKPARKAATQAAALIAVACAAALLATDRSPLIDPGSVTAYTSITATPTETPQHTVVYTAESRREDLLDPADPRELSPEDGVELLRLINTYRRTFYDWGKSELHGDQHQLIRISCKDGSYYLFDYWYWNGFSWSPLHFGEDPCVSLVTHYGADGTPGVTWKMEYNFDQAYRAWRNTTVYPVRLGFSNLSLGDRLECVYSGDGAAVNFLTDFLREEYVEWYPSSALDGPQSSVYFSGLGLSGGWAPTGYAMWTSERRNAMLLELHCYGETSIFTLDYTVAVNVPVDQAVISRKVYSGDEAKAPQFTDQEIVDLARRLAVYLRAGEEFYAAHPPA